MPRLIGIGTLRPCVREPVAEHLGRLVGTLQGARDHRAAARAAGGHVLRGHHDRGRAHEHRLAQVLHETDLARVDVGAGDERRVRRRHLVHELDEARVARRRARRTCPHRPCSSRRAGTAPTRRRARNAAPPSCVSARSLEVRDRRGEVDTQRAPLGTRELGHDVPLFRVLSVVMSMGSGQGTGGRARRFERQALKAASAKKNARPSQLTGDGSRPENQSGGGRVQCSAD